MLFVAPSQVCAKRCSSSHCPTHGFPPTSPQLYCNYLRPAPPSCPLPLCPSLISLCQGSHWMKTTCYQFLGSAAASGCATTPDSELNPSPHFVPRLLAARRELPLIPDAGGLPTRCSATDPQSKRTERCASIPPLVLPRGRAPQNFPAKTRQQERNHFTDCSEGSVRHPSISRQKLEQISTTCLLRVCRSSC